MATCAACDRPLFAAQGVAIVGTEVFHKACVRAVGTERSRLNRVIAESEQVRGFLERQLAEAQQHAVSMAAHAQRFKDVGEDLMKVAQQAKNELTLAKSRNVFLERQYDQAQLEINNMALQRNIAIAERDAAINEAALHQTINRGAPPRAAVQEVARTEPVDERDDAEQRFSLLELDIK